MKNLFIGKHLVEIIGKTKSGNYLKARMNGRIITAPARLFEPATSLKKSIDTLKEVWK